MPESPERALSLTRRSVLRTAGACAASVAAAPFIHARTPRSRLKLAAIGAANRAAANIAGVLSEDVALMADVDAGLLARGVAQVERAGQPKPKTYVDWRELLTKEEDLDGVVISTPDHLHAPVAEWALKRKLPVYCEKPLTRTVGEARRLRALAKEAGVATQMGTQIHATDNYRRVVEALRAKAIGEVQRVDVICSKSWSGGTFGEAQAAPEGLAWDLWLGPTEARPYCPGVHPANWRRFWAFGGGTVGDMACHWVDLVHWALELDAPTTVEAKGPQPPDAVGTPSWMHVTWGHPATETRGPVQVHWWDGGETPNEAPAKDCHVFRGTKGTIVSTYSSLDVRLQGEAAGATWEAPPQTIESSPGHYAEWLNAIKDSSAPAPLCEFGYGSRLTEAVLLANVAYRAGGKITWDAAKGEASAGQELIDPPHAREGWKD